MLSIPSFSVYSGVRVWWAKAKIHLSVDDLGQQLRRAIRAQDQKGINRILSLPNASEI